MTIKITVYDEIQAKIDEIAETCNFLPDVTTKEGYDKSKRVALDTNKVLIAIEKKRKEEKAQYLEAGRKVDALAKELDEKIRPLMLPHQEAYKNHDKAIKEREEKRKADLESRVEDLRLLPSRMEGMSSDEIRLALESVMTEECLDFYEFTELALKARNSSREDLINMLNATIKREKEAEELAKLRKEKEERERKEYEDNLKREAAAIAELEKEQAIQREIAAKAAAEEAERRRAESEKNAKALAEKAAEQARLAEIERQRLAADQERAEKEKREANTRHISKIRKEAKEALIKTLSVDEQLAKSIVMAIHNGAIKNITINY